MPKLVYKIIRIVIAIAIFSWFGVLLSHKINLTTADLGRHIQNGNIIVNGSWAEKWAVLHTNFYSYTLTNQPFINHHWLSGVVFYFIQRSFGFTGLSIFYLLLGLATLWLFFDVARRASNFWIAAAVTIIVMPLITSRAEVRPEMFTYFYTGVFFWILWRWREDAHKWAHYIWALPIVMLLWVNLHIGFVFGFLVLGAFGLEQLIRFVSLRAHPRNPLNMTDNQMVRDPSSRRGGTQDDAKKSLADFLRLIYISISCIIAGLINPNFIKGFLYPLSIFKNYGYLIVENQSIKFLENINFTADQHFLLFKIVAVAAIVGFIIFGIKAWRKIDIAMLVLTLVTAVMAYLGIRNFPSFAFFALPAIAASFYIIMPKNIHIAYQYALSVIVIVIVMVSLSQQYQAFLQIKPALGFGLLPGVEASADFYKSNNIQGPVFNNYDVGSYLIYELNEVKVGKGTGGQKVFVDNRPEAYSVDFFQNIYEPAQQDPVKWAELDGQYHFNAIFFAYHDYTPWAQAFLIATVNNPNWAPVYVDSYNIIFLRRDNPSNAGLIKKYELPKSMFGAVQN